MTINKHNFHSLCNTLNHIWYFLVKTGFEISAGRSESQNRFEPES